MAYFEVNKKPRLTFPALTGSIVTFNSQYAGLPLKSHKIALTATQSGSGTPSPDNVRPITGYSAINISHSDADTSNTTVYTIQIGSTVYGGEYDARTGVFKATWLGDDMGSLNWEFTSGTPNRFRTSLPLLSQTGSGVNGLCEIYPTSNTREVDHTLYMINDYWGGHRIAVYDSDYSSKEAFTTAVTGYKIVYLLATPQTIQLPPCPIDTLEGVNNIFADTGDTTLQYIKLG